MSKRVFARALVAALSVIVSACASSGFSGSSTPPQAQMRLLALEMTAPPPAGLVEFCDRNPHACGQSQWRGEVAYQATGGPAAVVTPDAGANLFQAMLAARRATLNGAAAPQSAQVAFPLDAARWRQLRSVNREINNAILSVSDLALYGRAEVWAMPLSSPQPGVNWRGDCEDFALEKRARLLQAGWPAESVSLATAIAPAVGMHAVLIVHTDHGDFVLDNLHREPMALETLNYVWLSAQTGANIMAWSSVQQRPAPRTPQSLPSQRPAEREALLMFASAVPAEPMAPFIPANMTPVAQRAPAFLPGFRAEPQATLFRGQPFARAPDQAATFLNVAAGPSPQQIVATAPKPARKPQPVRRDKGDLLREQASAIGSPKGVSLKTRNPAPQSL